MNRSKVALNLDRKSGESDHVIMKLEGGSAKTARLWSSDRRRPQSTTQPHSHHNPSITSPHNPIMPSLLGKKFPVPVGMSIDSCKLCADVGTITDQICSQANVPLPRCRYAQFEIMDMRSGLEPGGQMLIVYRPRYHVRHQLFPRPHDEQ